MSDLEICKINLLRGPNIWANFPVLEACVDLGTLQDASSDEVPGFNERLKAWLPGLIEHRCSVGERAGFFQRLDRGTYPAHVLEHVTLELQSLAGHRLGFGKARATAVDGFYKVVVRYLDETLVVACLRGARELLLAAYRDEPVEVAGEVARLRSIAARAALGPSAMAMVDAARDRGIPWRRLRENLSLVQLGHGASQRRVWTAETDRSGAIPEFIAQDKISRACCCDKPGSRCRRVARSSIPMTRGMRRSPSARPWWSNPWMPITAAACSSILSVKPRCAIRLVMRWRKAAVWWWRNSCRAPITACWWWATA